MRLIEENLIEIEVGFVIIGITAFIEYRASKYAITVFIPRAEKE